MSKKDTYEEIWTTLSAVNVNDHTQKKGGLTYLSWAWAWGVMMEHYPHMKVEWLLEEGGRVPSGVSYHNGGTASVYCQVRIGKLARECWLPVMDYRNKAIANPDARAINDSKMRCLVKCFALFGLGHYIYAGEDLPAPPQDDEATQIANKLRDTGKDLKKAGIEVPPEIQEIANNAYQGKNIDNMQYAIRELEMLHTGGEDG
jgi:hypothetical protein